jgi:hypothetical protein
MRFSVLAVSALLLAGCSSPSISIAPVTAPPIETIPADGVDELALEAVRDYLDASATIAADGGANPERIGAVVTESWLPQELAGFETLRAMGSAQVGSPTVTKMEVAAVRGIAVVSEVVVHACTALDGVAIRSEDGTDVPVTAGTTLVTVYVVPVDGVLKVDGVEPWADASWCDEA